MLHVTDLCRSSSRADSEGISIHLPFPQVHRTHARITCKGSVFYLTDLQSHHGTWITDNEGRRFQAPPNVPVRFRSSYSIEFGSDKKAVFKVKVLSKSQQRSAVCKWRAKSLTGGLTKLSDADFSQL